MPHFFFNSLCALCATISLALLPQGNLSTSVAQVAPTRAPNVAPRAAADDPFDHSSGEAATPEGATPGPAEGSNKFKPQLELKIAPEDEAKLRAALEKPVELAVINTGLDDVMANLQKQVGVKIDVDYDSLGAVGISGDAPVTRVLKNVRLKSALNLILDDMSLSWIPRDGSIFVTTIGDAVEANENFFAKVYRVDDLAPRDPLVEGRYDTDSMIDVIMNNVDADKWDDVDGLGGIRAVGPLLSVRANWQMHEQISKLLAALRLGKRLAYADPQAAPKLASIDISTCTFPSGDDDKYYAAIRAALKKEVDLNAVEMPLAKVIDAFKAQAGVEIQLDIRELEDIGVGTETPVTLKAKGTFASLLRLVTRQLRLTYTIRDDVILVTSPEEAENNLTVCVYPVLDLVLPASDGPDLTGDVYADYDSLLMQIMSVSPQSWPEGTGPAPIDEFAGCVVVFQTPEVQDEISRLFAAIRKAKAMEKAGEKPSVIEINAGEGTLAAKYREALSREVGMVKFQDASFAEVVAIVAAKTQVPMLIDDFAVKNAGIDLDVNISGNFDGQSLAAALKQLLPPFKLAYTISDDGFTITTAAEAKERFFNKIYPIYDFVAPGPEDLAPVDVEEVIDELQEAITSTVAPKSWIIVGGNASLELLPQATALLVRQTDAGHRELASLLEQLRRERSAAVKPSDKQEAEPADDAPAPDEQPSDPPAADQEAALRTQPGFDLVAFRRELSSVKANELGEPVYLKIYRLESDDKTTADDLGEMVRELVEAESWSLDRAHYLKSLPGALVVRHTAPAHRKIYALLQEARALAPAISGVYEWKPSAVER